jgi:lipid II:glycine glycyltransferase (peptidoglycan interpeptide bridge formation enzyme)
MTHPPSFLQSAEWGEFQRSCGRKTRRVNGALVIRHDLALGLHYLYCPRPDMRITDSVSGITGVREIARAEKSIFLKIDPLHPLEIRNTDCVMRDTRSLQPRQTVVLDLQKYEEELLAGMHEKTRYNIRLAERKGVGIRNQESGIREFEIFWRMLRDTAARDGFHTHERMYYEKLLDTRSHNFSNEIFFTEYRGETIAAALINFYRPDSGEPVATYLHGASSREYKEAMAPQLLHWRVIQEAKRRGLRYYDSWGIDEKRWPGLTRFKKGFGGDVLDYPPSVDLVSRPGWYKVYSLWRKFSRK